MDVTTLSKRWQANPEFALRSGDRVVAAGSVVGTVLSYTGCCRPLKGLAQQPFYLGDFYCFCLSDVLPSHVFGLGFQFRCILPSIIVSIIVSIFFSIAHI